MFRYKLLGKKGEGTFSEVLKAQNIETGSFHAIKCMKQKFANSEQVNSLREIQSLRRLSTHPHIVLLNEVLFDKPTGKLALVFELMNANLYDVIRERERPLSATTVQAYAYQIMTCLAFIHEKGVFHRDIKPENILVDKSRNHLKLADFGSVRGIHSQRPYTEYISTRWYRAPECLLTDGEYGAEVDIWGAGCVIFEIIALNPLFPGSHEIDQINWIHKILGSPPPLVWMKIKVRGSRNTRFDFPICKGTGFTYLIPRARQDCISFLHSTLKYDATERITASQALAHTYLMSSNTKSLDDTLREGVTKMSKNVNTKVSAEPVAAKKTGTKNSALSLASNDVRTQPEAKPRDKLKGRLPSLGTLQQTVGDTAAIRKVIHSTMKATITAKKVTPLPINNSNVKIEGTKEDMPEKSAENNLKTHRRVINSHNKKESIFEAKHNDPSSKESLPLLGKLRGGLVPPLVRKKPHNDSAPVRAAKSTNASYKRGSQNSVVATACMTVNGGVLLPPILTHVQRDQHIQRTKLLSVLPDAVNAPGALAKLSK